MFFTSFAITLPATAIQDILGNISGLASDLMPLILLIGGIIIGFQIIFGILGIIKHEKKMKRIWPLEKDVIDDDDDDDDDYDDEF